MVQMYIECKI